MTATQQQRAASAGGREAQRMCVRCGRVFTNARQYAFMGGWEHMPQCRNWRVCSPKIVPMFAYPHHHAPCSDRKHAVLAILP